MAFFKPPSYDDRIPLTTSSFWSILLPPIICYYVMAYLVLHNATLPLRLPLAVFAIWLAYRAGTSLDLSLSVENDRMIWMNQALTLACTTLAFRVLSWGTRTSPLRQRASSTSKNSSVLAVLDLTSSLRGLGWDWSHGLRTPSEQPKTKTSLILERFARSLIEALIFDLVHVFLQWYLPASRTGKGVSIFDESLDPWQKYTRSSILTLIAGVGVYCIINTAYDFTSAFCMLFFNHEQAQWPPLFDRPWLSTSLTEFWNRRWHQVFRESFLTFARPFTYLEHYAPSQVARVLGLFAAFSASGILHTFGVWGHGYGAHTLSVSGFFLLMAFGVLLEKVFGTIRGRKVGGIFGWLWTWTWLIGCGNMLVDAWMRSALIGGVFCPWISEESRPARILFDAVLRFLYRHGAIASTGGR